MDIDVQQLIDGQIPTLVEIYASWCPHCQHMMPIVENLTTTYTGKANIVGFDGSEHPEVRRAFGAKVYPTWILFKEGQEMWRSEGEKESWELEDVLDRYI